MRMIGSVNDEAAARAFGDYLVSLGIDSHVEASAAGGYQIWVEHDDHLDRAKAELDQYRANPTDNRYQGAAKVAQAVRKERERAAERRQSQYTDVRTSWARAATKPTPVTIAIIVLSVVIFAVTHMGARESAVLPLLIVPMEPVGAEHVRVGTLQDTVATHQYWRFVSPVFVHSGPLHLLFNMMWLLNLGGQIERQKGHWTLILLILLSAVPSNLAQYMMGSPFFGGMSGVVYALFGYVWMKSRLQPHEGMFVDQSTVFIMLGWMVLCMIALTGIANTAHVVGLVMGMLLGVAPYYVKKLRRQ